MKKNVYYLPGYGGELDTGLGEELESRGFTVSGRATTGEFAKLEFSDQIKTVQQDLEDKFWSVESRVIANSFGAYLFLHAQSQIPSYIGKVLLLSPIVGDFFSDDGLRAFSPPRAGKLKNLIESRNYHVPANCEIHVGENDWQSNPDCVSDLADSLNIPIFMVENNGHMLDKNYVRSLLDRWL